MPGGRPTDYTNELAIDICERIVTGESVRAICRDETMPCMASVFRWLAKHEEFREQYALAKELQSEYFSEEILDIADCTDGDTMTKTGKDGEEFEVANHEYIARSRLRVDTRKWLMGKLKPKKYGDKVQHTGDGGGAIKYSDVTDEELDNRIKSLISSCDDD